MWINLVYPLFTNLSPFYQLLLTIICVFENYHYLLEKCAFMYIYKNV